MQLNMQISIIDNKNILILEPVDTRIDATAVNDFKVKVTELIKDNHKLIVINLTNVEFIDSSGLGALVYVYKKIGKKTTLALCEINNAIMPIFKLTKLDEIFNIFANQDEAVAYFHQLKT